MKKCPVCKVLLRRPKYEDLPMFRCDMCNGCLMDAQRLEGIQRNPAKTVEVLKEEVGEDLAVDTTAKLECPSCNRYMKKEKAPPPTEIFLDSRDPCKLVWLDGGELSMLQLQYEISSKGKDENVLRERFAETSPTRKAQSSPFPLPEREGNMVGGSTALNPAFA